MSVGSPTAASRLEIMEPSFTHPVFAPPSDIWRPLSPRLVRVKRITASIWIGVITVGAATASWLFLPFGEIIAGAVAAVGLAWWLWLWFRAPRWVRSWGYAERGADLCVTHGLMFKELVVVPFGRMQVVKVSSGPLQRAHGLATVELVTASMQTDASIPGLPLDEARALRDRMIELSDAEGSGL